MVTFLIRTVIFLVNATLGLLVASWILDGFKVSVSGFLVAIVVFAIAQNILAPFIFKMARLHAPALLGGIGLVSTFVALLVATFFSGGITISGIRNWVLGTLIVWLVGALSGWILPIFLLKNRGASRKADPLLG
ncbi:phage holin family protein [Paeniglutamicibacter cryotolerans]|uniref:Uncharacterized membrane protein YvlD (DUF360 family) n=1 Tax=Paeniglutamicibacter cryotolerans TaxID=670079 RepID=A0A839QFP6_9MICC|nr:phage holin family protein [Paeniglutamicibacter cryotolerans]MBB2994969.1 uncharacterized membrane protein YvlD (DUF360 family) [Paeniglutamicibacter cryotolerans]